MPKLRHAMEYDLVGLRLFVLTAELQSLSRAAEVRHISLAAASARIKALEREAGLPLLHRKARGMSPTPAGEAFLRHARQVLRQAEQLRRDLEEYEGGLRGQLRIYANTTAVDDFLPDILPVFLAGHPHVNVELEEKLNSEIARCVLDGRADIGIVAGAVDTMGLECIHFSTDRLVLVVPRGHRLEGRRQVAFAEILDEPTVGMHPGSTLQTFLTGICESLGKAQRLRVQVSSFSAMCRMVGAGAGVGIVPESAARRYARGMRLAEVELADEWRVRERFLLLRHQERLPEHSRRLVELVCEYHRSKSSAGLAARQRRQSLTKD